MPIRRKTFLPSSMPSVVIRSCREPSVTSVVSVALSYQPFLTPPGTRPVHAITVPCGYYLASKGDELRLIRDYLGHRDSKHTIHDTRTAGRRFEGSWRRRRMAE